MPEVDTERSFNKLRIRRDILHDDGSFFNQLPLYPIMYYLRSFVINSSDVNVRDAELLNSYFIHGALFHVLCFRTLLHMSPSGIKNGISLIKECEVLRKGVEKIIRQSRLIRKSTLPTLEQLLFFGANNNKDILKDISYDCRQDLAAFIEGTNNQELWLSKCKCDYILDVYCHE